GLEADRMLDLELRTLAMSERRRVLLAAALARPFELLLFDGYGESLDPSARGRCLDLLEDACASGRAVLLTSRERHPAGITPTRTVDCLHEAADAGTAVPLLRRAKPGTRRPHAHPLLEAEHVWVTRGRRGLLGRLPAATPVADASLFVRHGEVVVLLGPSASGKTTFLETMAGLRPPVRGQIRVSGVEVVSPRGSHLRRLRREVQLVFQDAAGVLDAGRTVHAHLDEAKQLGRGEAQSAEAWLDRLGLPERLLEAPADVLSASEAARVDLARSLAVKPLMVLLDEPRDLGIGEDDGVVLSVIDAEKKAGTSFLVATSEPEVAATLADRIAIFAAGRVIELGSREDVLACPAHPLTRAFLTDQSSRRFDPRRVPPGCAFSGACEGEG